MAAPVDTRIEKISSASEDTSRSPVHHCDPYSSIQEQGLRWNSFDYYDIMIVGITGQGKSTTTDKMVLASSPDQITGLDDQEDKKFYVWLVGASPELMDTYLERLACSSHSEKPHLDVNTYYEELVEDGTKPPNTFSCQLISNEATRIRVLDVPGFFGDSTSTPSPSDTRINLCTQEHITAMRSILRIQSTMRLKFRRILYFLPVRGPLTNRNGILMHDLQLLNQFFGRSVFECMILVATLPTYQKDSILPDNLLEKTRTQFRIALSEVLRPFSTENAIPNPPVIFISMADNCEEIVKKVKEAEVSKDSLELSIDQGVCLKCSSLINWIDEERVECISGGGMENSAIPLDESFCHPIFLPTGCTRETIEYEDGMPYIVLGGKNLRETTELCLNCGKAPGSTGCMKVGKTFNVTLRVGGSVDLKVDHTNKIEYHRMLPQSKDLIEEDDRSLDLDTSDIHHDDGRPTPAVQLNPPQQPKIGIVETTGSHQGAQSISVLRSSDAVMIPGSRGRYHPPRNNYSCDTTSEEGSLDPDSLHRPIGVQDEDSSLVAEASAHDLAVKIVHGVHLSKEISGGAWDGVRRQEKERSQSGDPELEEVKG